VSNINNGVLSGARQPGMKVGVGPDGNVIISPPGGHPAGAWGPSDWLNVKTRFGARGNGVTDDTAAIQAAMNAAGPTGGTVYFPPGNYLVSSTLLWQPPAGGLTNQAFYAPSLIGAGRGATAPRFGSYAQGVSQITASASFPSGQFMIDYLGDTGSNNCIAGYKISGLSLQCTSLAAGIRNFNAHSSVLRRLTINHTATPTSADPAGGTPSGALSAVASPTANAENNHYEDIVVYGAGQDAFQFGEGAGSLVMADRCVSISAGRYGFLAQDGTVLTACSAQGSATADFNVYRATLVNCNNQCWNNGCNGNALLFTGNSNRQACVIGGAFGGNMNAATTGEGAALVNFGSGGEGFDVIFQGVNFVTGSHTSYWFYIPGSATSGNVSFQGCTFNTSGGALVTGNYDIVAALSSTFQVSVKNCPGLNPFGSQSVSVPLTTVATAGLPYDSTYYVTASSSGTTTVAISGGPTITIPASACVPVLVPAGQTLTPAYTSAPTWVVEGN
jgi:hypothetical protein